MHSSLREVTSKDTRWAWLRSSVDFFLLQSNYNSEYHPLCEMSPSFIMSHAFAERRCLLSSYRLKSTAKWVYLCNTTKDRDLNHEADTS